MRNEKFQYQRSDLWFILIPALYLLVPGSSVWRIAFFSIVSSTNGSGDAEEEGTEFSTEREGEVAEFSTEIDEEVTEFSPQSLISGIFIIGIGQVIGVRLALSSLVVVQEFKRIFSSKKDPVAKESPPMSRSESFELVTPETPPFKDEDPEI